MRLLTTVEKEMLLIEAKDLKRRISALRLRVGSVYEDENYGLDLEDNSLDATVREICRDLLSAAEVNALNGCPLCRS